MLLLLSVLWFVNQCCCTTITQTSAAVCCQQKRKVIQQWHKFLLLPLSRKVPWAFAMNLLGEATFGNTYLFGTTRPTRDPIWCDVFRRVLASSSY